MKNKLKVVVILLALLVVISGSSRLHAEYTSHGNAASPPPMKLAASPQPKAAPELKNLLYTKYPAAGISLIEARSLGALRQMTPEPPRLTAGVALELTKIITEAKQAQGIQMLDVKKTDVMSVSTAREATFTPEPSPVTVTTESSMTLEVTQGTAEAADESTEPESEPPKAKKSKKAKKAKEKALEETKESDEPPLPEGIPEDAIWMGGFKITYYCCERYKHICGGGTGKTATGTDVTPGRSIAVDPKIIPLGSEVYLNFKDGKGWHKYMAEDTGGLIKGCHIDVAIDTHAHALAQTKIYAEVYCVTPW